MKLYYTPDACSLAPHIVLRELGLPFALAKVDQPTKTTSDGEDYMAVNPHGYVAALKLDNGEVLTETSVILEFLADLKPDAGLAPPQGSWERVRMRERLSFLSCELNCAMSPLFNKAVPEEAKAVARARLFRRLGSLEAILSVQDYLATAGYSVADEYLFNLLRWPHRFAIDLSEWPALPRFQARIAERPAVRAALEAETA
ncbi:MAG TPA: glutathione transferase GstA [Luteibacter sp.]|uniref:glutathione transferase GstA n=1 Tax=Luteibacter sp. TaxID=1886636 RepID=UPI002D09283D|nr:glutathione transferase GstA [Luteibacter sp.]HVI54533.1 glutathione transferase GstA [Luteibacter sp.]